MAGPSNMCPSACSLLSFFFLFPKFNSLGTLMVWEWFKMATYHRTLSKCMLFLCYVVEKKSLSLGWQMPRNKSQISWEIAFHSTLIHCPGLICASALGKKRVFLDKYFGSVLQVVVSLQNAEAILCLFIFKLTQLISSTKTAEDYYSWRNQQTSAGSSLAYTLGILTIQPSKKKKPAGRPLE